MAMKNNGKIKQVFCGDFIGDNPLQLFYLEKFRNFEVLSAEFFPSASNGPVLNLLRLSNRNNDSTHASQTGKISLTYHQNQL